MKKILYLLVCLLLCIGIGGSAFILYKTVGFGDKEHITQGGDVTIDDGQDGVTDFDEPPADNGGNGDSSGGNTIPPELTPPTDEASYIVEGMTMMAGAQAYIGDDTSKDPAIRFTCLIDNALKSEVEADPNKSLAILAAPLDYFEAVNEGKTTYIDWVNAFATANKTVILSVFDDYGTYNDYTSYMRFTLANVLFQNMNRRFVAMGVLIDNTSGTPTYKYSAMPTGETYRSNARSVAYVAGAALNAHAMGLETFTEARLAKLRMYIDMAVDQANGLSAHTNNGDMPVVTLAQTSVMLPLSGSHTITGTSEPMGLDIPVKFVSSNENVAGVSESGVIYGRSYGSAVITLYYAGQSHTINVTCSSNVQYV